MEIIGEFEIENYTQTVRGPYTCKLHTEVQLLGRANVQNRELSNFLNTRH